MKTKFSDPQRLFLLCLCLLTSNLCAQITPAPSNNGAPVINYKVLNSLKLNAGDHFVTANRVAPPAFPSPTPSAHPSPTPFLTPGQLQALQARDKKPYKWIMLEATVYDGQTTEVRFYENGRQAIRVFSDINFDYLTGIPAVETTDTVYEYWIMVLDNTSSAMNEDPASLALVMQARQKLPNLIASPNSRSSYFISESTASTSVTNGAIAALNALHSYYDANHATLIPNYQKRMTDYTTQQQYLKDHPPVPQNTVINYWPIRSEVYLKGQN